jgi:ATP-dependent DNA helicase Rep
MRQLLEVLDDIRASDMSLQDASMQLLQRAGYLKWLAGQSDGDDRLQNVYQLIGMFKGMNYTDVLNRVFDEEDDPNDDKQGKVSMMTLHASKGLEFKHVFIVGFDSVMLPFHKAVQEGRIDEERRLAYVGVTRARDSLFLTYPSCRQTYTGPIVAEPSIFVSELGL